MLDAALHKLINYEMLCYCSELHFVTSYFSCKLQFKFLLSFLPNLLFCLLLLTSKFALCIFLPIFIPLNSILICFFQQSLPLHCCIYLLGLNATSHMILIIEEYAMTCFLFMQLLCQKQLNLNRRTTLR